MAKITVMSRNDAENNIVYPLKEKTAFISIYNTTQQLTSKKYIKTKKTYINFGQKKQKRDLDHAFIKILSHTFSFS